jgi:hypothetical protein
VLFIQRWIGRDGQPGQAGIAGNLIISVVNTLTGEMDEYPSVYKCELLSIHPFASPSGVMEPGQRVQMHSFVVTNKGGMPTPKTEMVVSMRGNATVVVEGEEDDDKGDTRAEVTKAKCTVGTPCSWVVRENIMPGGSLEISEPLYFRIAHGIKPAVLSEALNIQSELKMTAHFPRTNVEFKGFQAHKIPISISHPLEISVVAGRRVSVFDRAVPLTITVRNKSRLGYGMHATYSRLLRVTVELPDCEQHVYSAKSGSTTGAAASTSKGLTKFSLGSQVCYEIDFIAPRSEMTLFGTLSVSPVFAKLYDQVQLQYALSLGDLDQPMEPSAMDRIQQRTHAVQVAEYCTPISEADCVLVVSGTTTAQEVEYWSRCFRQVGFSTCVFNVALYQGLSYKFPKFNFCEQVSGRIVVILNKPYIRDDQPEYFDKLFYPLDFLEQSEMFEAARRRGVRTLVVNYSTTSQPKSTHHQNFRKYTLPMAALGTNKVDRESTSFDGRTELYVEVRSQGCARDELLPEKYEYCRIKLFRALFKPKESDFDNRMSALAEKIKICRPDRTYYLAKAFEEAVKGSGSKALVFQRYDCGDIELRRGLDTTYAMLASTESSAANPVTSRPENVTTFVLFKLLPLRRKLELFVSLALDEKPAHSIAAQAIISDIADEQKVFLGCVKELALLWGSKQQRLGGWLVGLETLQTFDFSDLCRIEGGGGAEKLKEMLLKIAHMATKYNKAHMIKSNFLAKAVLESCFAIMRSYLNITTEAEFNNLIQEFAATQQQSEDAEQIRTRLMDPFGVAVEYQFNHWSVQTSNTVSGTETLNTPATLSRMQNELPDMDEEVATGGAFSAAVSFYAQAPKYHVQEMPLLYPVGDQPPVPEAPGQQPSYCTKGFPAAVMEIPTAPPMPASSGVASSGSHAIGLDDGSVPGGEDKEANEDSEQETVEIK